MSRRNRRTGGGRQSRWDDADKRQPRRGDRDRSRPRRSDRQRRQGNNRAPAQTADVPAVPVSLIVWEEEPPAPACGRCREFLADEVTGRGECLHPGSGVLRPWWDTPGCAFFQR